MAAVELDLEYWRQLFATTETDIWTVLDKAITVAAADHSEELRRRRDSIVERLFSATSGSIHPEVAQERDVQNDSARDSESSPKDDSPHEELDHEAAVLEEIETESATVKSILTLKSKLNVPDQPEEEALNILHQLEAMAVSVEALKQTEVGKSVNALRKHSSKAVRTATKRLVRNWKEMVDDWVKSAEALARTGSSSAAALWDAEEDEHNGALPVPPIDQASLLAARSTSLEMSQLLQDFMTEDDPLTAEDLKMVDDLSGKSDRGRDPGRPPGGTKPAKEGRNSGLSNGHLARAGNPNKGDRVDKGAKSKGDLSTEGEKGSRDSPLKGKKSGTPIRANTPEHIGKGGSDNSGSGASVRPGGKLRKEGSSKLGTPELSKRALTPPPGGREGTPPLGGRGPTPPPRELSPYPRDRAQTPPPPRLDPAEAAAKLAESKRKLREGYMEVENAKKSRTIQEMKAEDIKPTRKRVQPAGAAPTGGGPVKSRPGQAKGGMGLRERLAKQLRR